MKLFFSATSPYVRKVLVCAITREIDAQIERLPSNPEALAHANPLGKVPTLLTSDGVALFDSPVICEYLDTIGDAPALFPEHGAMRWIALRNQAIGDGIMDAAVMSRGEVLRPAEPARQKNIDHQKAAVTRALAVLEAHLPSIGLPDIGSVSVACALGYLDFRFSDDGWRTQFPRLAEWFEVVSALPGLATTIPPG